MLAKNQLPDFTDVFRLILRGINNRKLPAKPHLYVFNILKNTLTSCTYDITTSKFTGLRGCWQQLSTGHENLPDFADVRTGLRGCLVPDFTDAKNRTSRMFYTSKATSRLDYKNPNNARV